MYNESRRKYFLQKFAWCSWICLLIAGIVIASFHPIFINLGKVNGKIPFSSTSVALLIEMVKFLVSCGFVMKELMFSMHSFQPLQAKAYILYAVPAILYTINNNLVTHIQMYMDPASFQILNNLKIAATAICYRVIITRSISLQKWYAITLLFVAGIVNSLGGLRSDNPIKTSNTLYITVTGVYMVITYCTISGVANVYTELILKRYSKTSVHFQNLILYFFGISLNAIMLGFNTSTPDLLHGFSIWTWLIVITQAINGIIISLVLKKSSNITRLFMVGSSMVFTSILAYFIFNFKIDIYFFVSFFIVIFALYLYHSDANSIAKPLEYLLKQLSKIVLSDKTSYIVKTV